MASSYYDSSGKNVVDGDVAYAADLNDINTATDTGFQLVEAAVDLIAANQSSYSDLAEKWAENPEDTAVTPGKYSALHWAAKAEDDAVQTAADRVQTGLDKVATAADRVQTGQDKSATAADRVQTGLDKVATAADRVQTGQDVIDSEANADRAELAAALVPVPVSGDEGKVLIVDTPFSNGIVLTKLTGVPIGSIIPWVGGYFGNGSNASFTSVLGNTAAAVNDLLNADGFYVCNGASLNLAGSSIFNGAGRYLPNLTDDRFLMGYTAAGGIGGDSAMAHTHTTGSFTLTINEIPNHTHNFISEGGSLAGSPFNTNTFGGNMLRNNNLGFTGGGAAHNHGSTGAATVTENRPKFLACFYIMKVV